MKKKYPIYSDTHFNFTMPWTIYNFVSRIIEDEPDGLILTGDIACGITIKRTLTFLAKKLAHMPIFFVVGNHDYYGTSFKETIDILNELCAKYSNLHWVTSVDSIALNDEVGLIGEEGWYDGRLGDPVYLAYNFDWIMISEFAKLKSTKERFEFGQQLADTSTANLKLKLEKALEKFNTIYIMTHMPPWAEAARSLGTAVEDFWLPYNVNYGMGQMIEDVMKNHDTKNVMVLAGHTHAPAMVHVSRNIECLVQGGKYLGSPTEHNCLVI